jgi:hypothetical protein
MNLILNGIEAMKGANGTHTIDRTTPPFTRTAALFVAKESGLHTNVTSAATSSGAANRFNSDVRRMVRKNSRSTSAVSGLLFGRKLLDELLHTFRRGGTRKHRVDGYVGPCCGLGQAA